MINWQKHIITDDKILQGKPIIKNTRISVEFILERLADGWSENEILENYPSLNNESFVAIYVYCIECFFD